MSIAGPESISSVIQQAQKLIDQGPANLKEFDSVLAQLDQQQGQLPQAGADQLQQPQSITLSTDRIGSDLRVQELTTQKQKIAQTPEGIRQLGNELQGGYNRLNDLVKELQGNRSYTPQELLGIQGEMHDLTLQIEVTTKVVSEAVSGIKQLMQQQV